MKDIDRNSRTLIVCFVIAIFGLVPLRFYEIGNQIGSTSSNGGSAVLGEQVSLPESELTVTSRPVLESPYEEIEMQGLNCLPREEADEQIGVMVEVLKSTDLSESTVNSLVSEIERVESSVCK